MMFDRKTVAEFLPNIVDNWRTKVIQLKEKKYENANN